MAVEWFGDRVRILDQTALPGQERYIDARDVGTVVEAIRSLAVRGAPLLGVTAGFALALVATTSRNTDPAELLRDLDDAGELLIGSRPTAVNIAWAVRRVLSATRSAADGDPGPGGADAVREAAVAEALRISQEEQASCAAIGRHGAELVPEGANVLTHCNTGMLATGGMGTAQAIVVAAHEQGRGIHVWVDETRPLLQGARLTAWELGRLGVPLTLVADVAAASLMARGQVDLIVVGADRIAANGDVANKVGTYALAVLARAHRIPFYVAAPVSTIDPLTTNGAGIVIEERDPGEVTRPFGVAIAPAGTPARNPAFDVTPASLVTAIVTERGVARAPYRAGLRRLVREARDEARDRGRTGDTASRR